MRILVFFLAIVLLICNKNEAEQCPSKILYPLVQVFQNQAKHRVVAGTGLQTCTIICTSPDVRNHKKISFLIPENMPSSARKLLPSINILHTNASGDAGILVWRR